MRKKGECQIRVHTSTAKKDSGGFVKIRRLHVAGVRNSPSEETS